jgi:hypothetical protein
MFIQSGTSIFFALVGIIAFGWVAAIVAALISELMDQTLEPAMR